MNYEAYRVHDEMPEENNIRRRRDIPFRSRQAAFSDPIRSNAKLPVNSAADHRRRMHAASNQELSCQY